MIPILAIVNHGLAQELSTLESASIFSASVTNNVCVSDRDALNVA